MELIEPTLTNYIFHQQTVSLRYKIFFGYAILMAVIGSMAAILIHEPAKFHDLYAYVE